jgi:hypothetical protein
MDFSYLLRTSLKGEKQEPESVIQSPLLGEVGKIEGETGTTISPACKGNNAVKPVEMRLLCGISEASHAIPVSAWLLTECP